jgi:hypothetical protein
MLMGCDNPVIIHKFCSMLPAFVFQVHPVIPIEDVVRGELEGIGWRDTERQVSSRCSPGWRGIGPRCSRVYRTVKP